MKDRLPDLKARMNEEENTSKTKKLKPLKMDRKEIDKDVKPIAEFLFLVEEVAKKNESLSLCVEDVNKKQLEILANPTNDATFNKQLDSLNGNAKMQANEIRNKLKVIDSDVKASAKCDQSSTDYRIKSTQNRSLSTTFVQTMTNYNQLQMDYKNKCKNRIQRKLEIIDHKVNQDQLEEMIENPNPAIFTQSIMVDTQKAKDTLADIEARHVDILKLESSIVELNQMFLDISLLVSSQGEIVDNIEFNVQQGTDYVIQAGTDLHKAKKSKSSLRKKKVWLAIAGAVTVVVIVIIIIVSV